MSFCASKLSVLVLVLCSLLVGSSSGNSWYSLSSWLPPPEGSQQKLQGKQEQGRFFSGANYFCGPSATDPVGECVPFSKCYGSGGSHSSSSTCPVFGKSCCQYIAPCNAIVKTQVAHWQSSGYPGDATGPTTCSITVKPRTDTCYIRVQFLDTLLTASTVDVCSGNTLTIDHQAEGDSSLICSSLDNYETFVRVRTTPLKFSFNRLEDVRLTMRIRDSTYRYNIKITQVTCAQIKGIAGGVGGRSLDFTGRSLDSNSVDDSTQYSGPPKDDKRRYSKLKLRFRNEAAAAVAAAATAEAAAAAVGNVTYDDYDEFVTQSSANDTEYDLNQVGVGTDSSPTQESPDLEEITLLQGPSGLLGFFLDNESELDNSTISMSDLTRLATHSGLVTDDNTILVRDLCAVAERDVSLRIADVAAGAVDAVVANAPYFGTVMIQNDGGEFFLCGATLIAPTYVLTAASCLLRQGYDNNMYDIRAHFNTVNDLGANPGRTYATMWARTPQYKVKRVVFHPMYDHNNFHYDIAVMELETAVTGNTPIALPQRGDLFEHVDVAEIGHGLSMKMASFSAIDYRQTAKVATGKTRTVAECRADYANAPYLPTSYTGQFVKDEMLCVKITGPPATSQVCEGDQGGPVVTGFGGSAAVLVGIISGNQHNCIDPLTRYTLGQYPDIAVRITSVLDFINAATTTIQYDVGAGETGLWELLTNIFNLEINAK